jgi:hypothetical protein
MMPNSTKNPYTQVAFDLAQRHEAQRVFSAFASAGLKVIGLKGVVLKDDLYATAERRPMYDIDILVRRPDIERAENLLIELGYHFLSDGNYNIEFAREFMGEIPYKKGSVIVELHWHVVSMNWNRRATRFDLASMWERVVEVEVLGSRAFRFCLEDEVIYLCYHLAVPHSLWHPSGIQDLYRLILKNEQQIDWSLVVSRAKMWHVRVVCWAALMRLQMSTELPISESVLTAFQVPRWRQKLLCNVMRSTEQVSTVMMADHKRFLGVFLIDDLTSLPKVLLGGIFPGRQWLKTRYNISNSTAYWRQLIYPFEVIIQAFKAIRNT